jgi:prolyl 4-hydroxylase
MIANAIEPHMSDNHPLLQPALALFSAGRTAEGIAEITRLSLQGLAPAVRLQGEIKWSGMDGKSDPAAGRRLFERAGSLGDPQAAIYATNLLSSGVAGPRDWSEAMRRLRTEAASDLARAGTLKVVETMKLDFGGDPISLPEPETISDAPRIRIFRQLFTAAECEYVLKSAEGLYKPSMVYNSARQLVRDPIRTSDGATMHWLVEDPAIHALLRRIGKATGTDPCQGEAAQVLRYQPGQEYKPHYDYLRASENQRIVTALVWLNEDYAGGETAFIRTGQKLRGKKGDAVVFWNSLADGSIDPLTEHAGLPVRRGTKLLFNRWIRAARWQP